MLRAPACSAFLLVTTLLAAQDRPDPPPQPSELDALAAAARDELQTIGYFNAAELQRHIAGREAALRVAEQRIGQPTDERDRDFVLAAARIARAAIASSDRIDPQIGLARLQEMAEETAAEEPARKHLHGSMRFAPSRRLRITETEVESETTARDQVSQALRDPWQRIVYRVWVDAGRDILEVKEWRQAVAGLFAQEVRRARAASGSNAWDPLRLAELIRWLSPLASAPEVDAAGTNDAQNQARLDARMLHVRLRVCRAPAAQRAAVVAQLEVDADNARRAGAPAPGADAQPRPRPLRGVLLATGSVHGDGWRLTSLILADPTGGSRARGRPGQPAATDGDPLPRDRRDEVAAALRELWQSPSLARSGDWNKAVQYLLAAGGRRFGDAPRIHAVDAEPLGSQLAELVAELRPELERQTASTRQRIEQLLQVVDAAAMQAQGIDLASSVPVARVRAARIEFADGRWLQVAGLHGKPAAAAQPLDPEHPFLRGADAAKLRQLSTGPGTSLLSHRFAIDGDVAGAIVSAEPFPHGRSVHSPYRRETLYAGRHDLRDGVPAVVFWREGEDLRGLLVESCGTGFADVDLSALLRHLVEVAPAAVEAPAAPAPADSGRQFPGGRSAGRSRRR